MIVTDGKFYKTEAGFPVVIHEYNGKGTFPIKGSIYKRNKGFHNNPTYEIWQNCGMNKAIEKSSYDLLEITSTEFGALILK